MARYDRDRTPWRFTTLAADAMFRRLPAHRGTRGSTLMCDESDDLVGQGEDHVGAVAHHSGSYQGRRTLLGTFVADVGLEAQVAFPEIANLAVRGRNLVGVAAVSDRLHPILGI